MNNDWFSRAFGAAIDDMRKKIVEEPWFGRALSKPLSGKEGFDLGWTQGEDQRATPGQDHSHEIDR